MNAIEERITKVLIDNFKVESDGIGAHTTFTELGFDSLVIVELALVLSDEFGITLTDGELLDGMTVAQAAVLIEDKGGLA